MANYTPYLDLKKPLGSEYYNVADQNGNMDKIDTSIQGLGNGLGIIAKGNTHAAITSGEYVYVHGHGTLAEGLYKATANIAANGTLTSSNLAALPKGVGGDVAALNSNIATLNSNLPSRLLDIPQPTLRSVELLPSIGANHGGYIDFHYDGDETVDNTSRIIESERGKLNVNGVEFHNGLSDLIVCETVQMQFTNGEALVAFYYGYIPVFAFLDVNWHMQVDMYYEPAQTWVFRAYNRSSGNLIGDGTVAIKVVKVKAQFTT